MEQYEPLDLTKQFDIPSNKIGGYFPQLNQNPLYQSPCPENRTGNIVNIVNGHSRQSYMPSTHGPCRSSASRRVALVQPQRGESINVCGRGNRNEFQPQTVKSKPLKPTSLQTPSIETPIFTQKDTMATYQEIPEMAILQANTLPGAQSVDSQQYLLLAPEQLMPLAISQLGIPTSDPLHTSTVVQSTLQNIRIENVTQFPSSMISSGRKDISMPAPNHVLAGATGDASCIPHLSQNNTNTFNFGLGGVTVPEEFRLPAPKMNVDKAAGGINLGKQLQVPINKDLYGFGDINRIAQDVTENCDQEMQVINVRSLRDSNTDLRDSHSQHDRQRRHKTEERDLIKGRNAMLPDAMKGQIDSRLQAVSDELQSLLNNSIVTTTKNVQISTCHTIHEQHTNGKEQTSSATNQRPSTPKWKYPMVTALLQDDTSDLPPRSPGLSQVRPESDYLPCRDTRLSEIAKRPRHHQTNQNGYLSYRNGRLQERSGKHRSHSGNTHDAVKRKKLEMFQKLDKQEKTALLREKYAELLKQRRKQLHTFDPRYKISLRRMKHASRELQNLSVMTKLNCPPKFKSKISKNYSATKSKTISFSTADFEHKTEEPIVIDLTEDEPSPKRKDTEQHEATGQTSGKSDSRLPSYEEALAAKENLTQEKISVDVMSSVARRLLSSSQEFLKSYHGSTKPLASGEALHTENASIKEINLDSIDDSQAKHSMLQDTLENPQRHLDFFTKDNDLQKASELLQLSPPCIASAELFSNQEHLQYSQCHFDFCSKDNERQSATVALELSPPSIDSAETFLETSDMHGWPDVDKSPSNILQRHDVSVPHLSDTLTSELKIKEDDPSLGDKEGSSPPSPGVSTGISEGPPDTPTTRDSTGSGDGTVFLGSEKHTLKNAIVRIEDIRKKSRERRKHDIGGPCSNTKRSPRRRRRSNNDLPKRRKRKSSPRPTGSPRSRSSSPASHYAFRDFVPTIMPSRTRATTSGHITSCQTLAMELLQYDLDDAINDGTEVDQDVDDLLDEDYSPHKKQVRRHHAKIQKSTSVESETTSGVHPIKTASGSMQYTSGSNSSASQPLRVEIGTNDQNHIRLKFVNLRSIQDRSNEKHKRKTKCVKVKRSVTMRPVVTDPQEQFKFDFGSPSEEGQKAKYTNASEKVDFNGNKMKNAKLCDVSSRPPAGMEKIIINKKVGETLLHRAAKLGNVDILQYCIPDHDVNARDKAGYTPLHDSCVPGHVQVAQILLDHGADVNSEASDGTRPIHDAVENNHVDFARLLLDYGADPFLTSATGRTAVQQALDRSSEMRNLILGFLEDMKGEKS